MKKIISNIWSPASITFLFVGLVISLVIIRADGDALALARIGTQFSQGDVEGTEGYDGQFVYYIANEPNPDKVGHQLDTPAYRYQRILLPLTARVLSLGNPVVLPWILGLIGLVSHTGGTWLVSKLLISWGVNRWYSLVYGLWVGLVLAVRLDLPEPLAYGLVVAAILSLERDKKRLGWGLFGLALFAKEVTILFVGAQLLRDAVTKRWSNVAGLGLVSVLPFVLFQVWLWTVFGQPGISSGGAMATPFEWIPFMGIIRVAEFSQEYFLALLAVYSPFIIFPTLWGLVSAARRWLIGKKHDVVIFALLLNAAIIPFIPFSTFREPGGMLRFSSGLVLAVLLYAGKYDIRRALNYSVFWMALNVILLNELL